MNHVVKTRLNRQKPIKIVIKGGAGSGHHGHRGRPGKRGGSLPGSGSTKVDILPFSPDDPYILEDMGYEDDPYDLAEQADDIAKETGIYISSDKNLTFMAVGEDGKVKGAVYASVTPEAYSFDTVVDPKSQGQGIGSQLIDQAIGDFRENQEWYPDLVMEIDAVNPLVIPMMEKRGAKITNQVPGHTLMELKEHEGMMVAWFLPMALSRAIHSEQTAGTFPSGSAIEKPEDYHITIVYMKDRGKLAKVKSIVERITKKYRPFRLDITGNTERFEEVEDGTVDAIYASIQSETLHKFRDELVKALGDGVSTHGDGYTPHITLAYVPTGSEDKAKVIPINITVGEVHLAVGDEVYRYPLSGYYKQIIVKGGPGSGHRGHSGRPGKVGGSL
ncbi:hypothetical protein LCGC14_1603520, partial [marine sediment metagenome]